MFLKLYFLKLHFKNLKKKIEILKTKNNIIAYILFCTFLTSAGRGGRGTEEGTCTGGGGRGCRSGSEWLMRTAVGAASASTPLSEPSRHPRSSLRHVARAHW